MFKYILVAELLLVSTCIYGAENGEKTEKGKECPLGHGKPFGEHVPEMLPIKEVNEPPTPEEFYSEYFRKSVPVVVRGVGKHWPALKNWANLSYVLEHNDHGKSIHTVNWHGLYGYDYKHNQGLKISMGEFIHRMKKQENVYLDSTLPWGMWKDVKWPRFLACDWWIKQLKQIAIFFNSGKSNTDIHIDTTETLFFQITGKRRWILSPPKFSETLLTGRAYHPEHRGASRVDTNKVDLLRDKSILNATLYVTWLEPGDMIYVPETWYHQVKTRDAPNIAMAVFINVLWCTKWHDLLSNEESDIALLNTCLKLRDSMPKEISCKEPPEVDMVNLEQLKLSNRYPNSPGLEVCKKNCDKLECGSIYNEHLVKVHNSKKKAVSFPLVGVSFVGKSKEFMESPEALKIMEKTFKECNRMVMVSPEDDSLKGLAQVYKKLAPKMKKSYKVVMEVSFAFASKDRKLTDIVKETLSLLDKKRVDLLMLRAPFCDPPKIINTTEGCDRDLWMEKQKEWLGVWKEAESLWNDNKILALGVKDMTLKEVALLREQALPKSISVISARVDPFFRNSALRQFAAKYDIQMMAHGILGGHYIRNGMQHPSYTSHEALRAAFSCSSTVYTSSMDWALKKGLMVIPRVKSYWEARWLLRVFTLQTDVDHTKNAESLNNLIKDDPLNSQPLEKQESDRISEETNEIMVSFSNEPDAKHFSYYPKEILQQLQNKLEKNEQTKEEQDGGKQDGGGQDDGEQDGDEKDGDEQDGDEKDGGEQDGDEQDGDEQDGDEKDDGEQDGDEQDGDEQDVPNGEENENKKQVETDEDDKKEQKTEKMKKDEL